ncbi:MAG: AI-2E family transporter [Planctomycetia bacterium]|nr:AI-2E family transporter [Planctomycetia bacterium]
MHPKSPLDNSDPIPTDTPNFSEPTFFPEKFLSKPSPQKISRFIIIGAATVILLAGIKAANDIVAPVLLALFVTIILLVPLRWLQKKGCPSIISLILVLGTTLMLFLGIAIFVGQSLNNFIGEIPVYREKIALKIQVLEQKLEQYGFALGWDEEKESLEETEESQKTEDSQKNVTPQETGTRATEKNPSADLPLNTNSTKNTKNSDGIPPENLIPSQNGETEELPSKKSKNQSPPSMENLTQKKNPKKTGLFSGEDTLFSDYSETDSDFIASYDPDKFLAEINEEQSLIPLDTKTVMYWITKSVVEIKNLAAYGFLVMIFTLFMIFEAARFPAKVDLAFGKEAPIGNKHFHHIAHEIRRYLFLKAISSLLSAAAATMVYVFFGVPAALFWGLVAFFLYFIPNIGGIVASIIPGLLIFMTYDVQGVILYILCLTAIECTIGYGIEPKMLGHGLGISTVVILMSLFFWGWILGLVGFFLAAPLTIMVKIVLQAFKETEWLAILIGDQPKHTTKHFSFFTSEEESISDA